MQSNSNEAELKRQRRSLIGKIDRRETTIILLRGEVQRMRIQLRIVEEQLAEYRPVRSGK